MKNSVLIKLNKHCIQGTEEKAPVILQTALLCSVTNTVAKAINLKTSKVHVTTKMLKHLYDSKPAEEYEFVLRNMVQIVRFPDFIYKNKKEKRGQYCFVKKIKNHSYFCSIETTQTANLVEEVEDINFVATAFRIRKENYLQGYKLLWSRKGDLPSS
ncbi:MAG: hypothetical protein AAB599_00535 [Patescibacteria group bacterium]